MAQPWSDSQVISSRPAAAGLTEVLLDVRGTRLEGAHCAPGQYLLLGLPGHGEGYFGIASTPGIQPGQLELLVRAGTPLTDALIALSPGAEVQLGPIEGRGFPVEAARGRHLLLFGTGSGIGPLRSVLEWVLRKREAAGAITLYFGARTPDGFAYLSELARWRAEGIEVIQTVSQPGDSGWTGLTGYVQHHVPRADLSGAVAFLCGHEEMVKGVREVLVLRGLPPERIFTNY